MQAMVIPLAKAITPSRSIPEDPEDKVWPDYFRADVVSVELASVLNEHDEVDDHFYTTEAGWFQAGWKAREKACV